VSNGQDVSPDRRRAAQRRSGSNVGSRTTREPASRSDSPVCRHVHVQAQPDLVAAAVNPPSVEEMGACRMPLQVDLRSAAGLLTWRPEASLPELEAVLTDLISRRDETAYSRAAISLAIRAMHVYEDVLAERLQDLFQVSYCDDHTGWMGMRRCADLLQIMTRRRTTGVAPAPSAATSCFAVAFMGVTTFVR